eukprot:4831009-Pleurochrysis_carterae.AAC.1
MDTTRSGHGFLKSRARWTRGQTDAQNSPRTASEKKRAVCVCVFGGGGGDSEFRGLKRVELRWM